MVLNSFKFLYKFCDVRVPDNPRIFQYGANICVLYIQYFFYGARRLLKIVFNKEKRPTCFCDDIYSTCSFHDKSLKKQPPRYLVSVTVETRIYD